MKKPVGAVSYPKREIEQLRADREFAVDYGTAAMESLDHTEECGSGHLGDTLYQAMFLN